MPAYDEAAKQRLGEAIAMFMTTASYWPDSLQDYYDELPADRKNSRKGRQLTIEMLQEWMAIECDFPPLADGMEGKYWKLLTRWIRWDTSPEAPGGDNFILMQALTYCGIARDPETKKPITHPLNMVRFLSGLPLRKDLQPPD